ncbi:MAG: hypothetical protein AAGH68_10390 [Pseudomonadota bacterium]
MTKNKDDHIVAKADPDAPEILEEIALDQVTGGAQYGSSNSCEPVTPLPTETVTLNYARVEWTYDEAKAKPPRGFKSS